MGGATNILSTQGQHLLRKMMKELHALGLSSPWGFPSAATLLCMWKTVDLANSLPWEAGSRQADWEDEEERKKRAGQLRGCWGSGMEERNAGGMGEGCEVAAQPGWPGSAHTFGDGCPL